MIYYDARCTNLVVSGLIPLLPSDFRLSGQLRRYNGTIEINPLSILNEKTLKLNGKYQWPGKWEMRDPLSNWICKACLLCSTNLLLHLHLFASFLRMFSARRTLELYSLKNTLKEFILINQFLLPSHCTISMSSSFFYAANTSQHITFWLYNSEDYCW